MSTPPKLDLGKLLRLEEMVTQASLTQATIYSSEALVRAYETLRTEILDYLKGTEAQELHEEFERLFQPIGGADELGYQEAAEEGLLRLRLIGGWIKGLIRKLTLTEQMRLDAEAKARFESKPPTGFGP
jgi:hypothetical protein